MTLQQQQQSHLYRPVHMPILPPPPPQSLLNPLFFSQPVVNLPPSFQYSIPLVVTSPSPPPFSFSTTTDQKPSITGKINKV